MTFYSRRNAPPPTELLYDVPDLVRNRIIAIVDYHIGKSRARGIFLETLGDLLTRQYGYLEQPGYEAARQSDIPVVQHFFSCTDEQALDFIEACFRLNRSCGGQAAVDEMNAVLREEGIGYELTKYLGPGLASGEIRIGQPIPEDQLPRVIRVDSQAIHAEVVTPALGLLSNPIFGVANTEMLKAHGDHRAGRHEDAITTCSSAFESVLKTICGSQGWTCDAEKDTCATLVGICHKQGLFPSFYVELFKRVGTIRNKLGDAHGRGPMPTHDVEAAHAEHMLHMTSAHIILLCKLAGLE